MNYLKSELKQFIYDCVVQGFESVEELGVSAQKKILCLILKQAKPYRSHEIFVDADRDDKLPILFCSWLDGNLRSEQICEYLLSIGMRFYDDEISDMFEDARRLYHESLFQRRVG